MTNPFLWQTGAPSVVLADKTLKASHTRSMKSMQALERARREGRDVDIQGYGRRKPKREPEAKGP